MKKNSLKSTPPSSIPMGGMMTSSTRDLMMVPKAAPMMIPTAMSSILPFTANSLNSLSTVLLLMGDGVFRPRGRGMLW